jgi:hypothetical protein
MLEPYFSNPRAHEFLMRRPAPAWLAQPGCGSLIGRVLAKDPSYVLAKKTTHVVSW